LDQQTRDNWLKIKQALEAAGKTDNHYYKRAVEITRGKSDPFDKDDWTRALG
jgi:hypothetical protein